MDRLAIVRHPFFASSRSLVFAHRGGSALAPENTMAAFDNGLALGADGLELDVHLSRDGVVVVHHDRLLDRTTTLRGPIAERTARELQRASVPTLAEVLARYRDPRIIIEMKVNHAALAAATIDVIRRAGAVDRVCLGSFGLRVLRAARAIEPAIATSGARERGALGAVSLVVPLAGVARRPTAAIRSRSSPAARASCRRASSSTRTTPGSACRCGPSTPRTPRGVCSAGASTR